MLIQRADGCAPKIGVDLGLGNVPLQRHADLGKIIDHYRFDVLDFRNGRSGLPSPSKWTADDRCKLPLAQVVGKLLCHAPPTFCKTWVARISSPVRLGMANDGELKWQSVANPPLAFFSASHILLFC